MRYRAPSSEPRGRTRTLEWMLALITLGASLALPLQAFAAPPAQSIQSDEALVDLNRAPVERFLRLPGIGATRAAAIIEYRKRRPFRRRTELMRVPGIGPKSYVRVRDLICVGAGCPPT